MKDSVKHFLEFNGKTLLFLAKDGQYYVAIKPICEALDVNYERQFRTIRNDEILGPALSLETIQIPNDQAREMLVLPEYFIYGWIFSIKTVKPNPKLIEYKKECYLALYKHFHGMITRRSELLKLKTQDEKLAAAIEAEYKEDIGFQKYIEIQKRKARLNNALRKLDSEFIEEQMDLWEQDFAKDSSTNGQPVD